VACTHLHPDWEHQPRSPIKEKSSQHASGAWHIPTWKRECIKTLKQYTHNKIWYHNSAFCCFSWVFHIYYMCVCVCVLVRGTLHRLLVRAPISPCFHIYLLHFSGTWDHHQVYMMIHINCYTVFYYFMACKTWAPKIIFYFIFWATQSNNLRERVCVRPCVCMCVCVGGGRSLQLL
jgi:hypothetical protein